MRTCTRPLRHTHADATRPSLVPPRYPARVELFFTVGLIVLAVAATWLAVAAIHRLYPGQR